jgi:quercetin dioxygenase-like cupin family protein
MCRYRTNVRLSRAFEATAEALPPSFDDVTYRRFEFPDGALYEVVVPAGASAGARSEVEITLPPASVVPPPHIHPRQQETCTVGDGTLDVLVGRQWRTLLAGESLTIPPGSVHTFRNRSAQNVTFRSEHTPALGFQQYLERLYWLSAMNRIRGRRDVTSALYTSLLLDMHRSDQVPAGAGARIGVRALARVARLLRMRVDR